MKLYLLFIGLTIMINMSYSQTTTELLTQRGEQYIYASEFDSAAHCLNLALELKVGKKDEIGQAEIHLTLGKVYKLMTDLDKSYKSLKIAEQLFTKNHNHDGVMRSYIAQIEHYRYRYNWGKAFELIEKGRKHIEQYKLDPLTIANYYNRCAAVHIESNSDFIKTIDFSLKAIAIAKEFNDKELQASSLNEIGFVYENLNDTIKAKEYYLEALHLYKSTGNFRYISDLYGNLTRYHIKFLPLDSALYYAQLGYDLAIEKDDLSQQQQFAMLLANIHKINLNFESALYYEKQDCIATELLYIKKWNKQLAEIEQQYEVQQKNNEIEFNRAKIKLSQIELNRTESNLVIVLIVSFFLIVILLLTIYFNLRQRRSNRHLKTLLEENSFLLGESNHRIKNNLQLVTSILHRKLDKEEKNSDILEVIENIESISTLHKHIYLSKDKHTVNIYEYLNDLQENFSYFAREKNIQIEFEVDSLEVEINHAMYTGLLITELIINSIKHAFYETEKPKINLQLKRYDNKNLRLTYRDNGSGIQSKEITPTLVILMSRQLKGDYEFEIDKGFNFTLTFKS